MAGLAAPLKLTAVEESPMDGSGSDKAKGKGKRKGKGKGKGSSWVQNDNGSERQEYWDYEEYHECWKQGCRRAHIDPKTLKNQKSAASGLDRG